MTSREPVDSKDLFLETDQLILKYGFNNEKHEITTEDGYILTANRILGRINETTTTNNKPVVFLMHGLMGMSKNFVSNGKKSLGYVLANNGYDVWLGNARGTRYSRKHTTLTTKDKKYWNFSWNEIGVGDLPAFIDYILEITNQKQLNYIGHSQGTTAFFVLMSEKPEYNEKIVLHQSLSPVLNLTNTRSPLFMFLGKYWKIVDKIFNFLGINEVRPEIIFQKSWVLNLLGKIKIPSVNLLTVMMDHQVGINKNQTDIAQIPIAASQMTSVSVKQLFHFGQLVDSKGFQKYDHGLEINLELYKNQIPAEYKLDNIRCSLVLHHGDADKIVKTVDVEKAMKSIPNVVAYNKISDFQHMDFIYAIDANELINSKILEYLRLYNGDLDVNSGEKNKDV